MIAVVTISKNEVDIIESWVTHMLAEGVDRIYIADGLSGDGTFEKLEKLDYKTKKITLMTDMKRHCEQSYWMNLLARHAHDDGHEWIIASDVDEYWYATNGETVAKALLSTEATKVYARSYQHHDWATRQAEPKRLPKVAFRWQEGAVLAMGNHEVSMPGGEWGVLDLRELQFRSFEHYCRKVKERLATLDPAERARGNAVHYTRLDGKNDEELRKEWDQMMAIPTVQDPIPTHVLSP